MNSFWKKTLTAGMEAVGLDPREFGVGESQRQQQQPQLWQPRPPVPGDSHYVSPAQQLSAHAHQQQPQHPPYSGQAPLDPNDEKGREIERLRKELRKVEDKTDFFKQQVLTLQQQVDAMDPTGMARSSNAPSNPAEVQQLQQELQWEQARTKQLRAEIACPSQPSSAGPHHARSEQSALDLRMQELERELAALRTAQGITSVATPSRGMPHRSMSRSMSGLEGFGSPMSSLPTRGRDLLDPIVSPGGAKRAVIVGCNYPGQIGTLRAGVGDAQQWARFFTKRCGIAEKDIRLLTDNNEVYMQSEGECSVATKDNIMRALNWLTSRSATGDQVFFVFCGLGVQVVAEEFAGNRLCENSIAPTDVGASSSEPRVVSDTDVHKALQLVPSGAQATVIYDSCHAGSPLDRQGLSFLTEHVKRGTVDYDKLKGHPVLPRFLELGHWKVRSTPPDAVRESTLRCQAVQWSACANDQFCVELPIEEKARGVFTYILICALLKEGISATSDAILSEMRSLTASLKGRWRLQQDVRMVLGAATSGAQRFLQ